MINYLKGHLVQYLSILLLFALTVTAISSNIPHATKLFTIVLSIMVYFFWSIWHHWEDHKMSLSVVLEYIMLVALLFLVLINLAA